MNKPILSPSNINNPVFEAGFLYAMHKTIMESKIPKLYRSKAGSSTLSLMYSKGIPKDKLDKYL